MRREPGSFVKESSRNRSCAAASCLAHATPGIAYGARMSAVVRLWVEVLMADGNGGASQRIDYGSVGCVRPVASKGVSPSRRAGIVFGGDRWFGFACFCKVSSRHLPSRLHAACQPPHCPPLRLHAASCRPAALRSQSPSSPRARIALGRRRGANAGEGLSQWQCQPGIRHLFRRHGTIRRSRFIEPRRRSAPLHRGQPNRAWQSVVRPVHEHGAAARGLSWHRL